MQARKAQQLLLKEEPLLDMMNNKLSFDDLYFNDGRSLLHYYQHSNSLFLTPTSNGNGLFPCPMGHQLRAGMATSNTGSLLCLWQITIYKPFPDVRAERLLSVNPWSTCEPELVARWVMNVSMGEVKKVSIFDYYQSWFNWHALHILLTICIFTHR